MTGKKSTDLSSVLPLDARTARIAADDGLVSSAQGCRAGEADEPEVLYPAGLKSERLDFVMPHAAGSRTASSLSVPCPSVQDPSLSNLNPT